MKLTLDRAVVVLDTSAVIEIARSHLRGGRFGPKFSAAVTKKWGSEAQLAVHPVTFAEIATNTHEEVLHARRGRTSSPDSLALKAKAHQWALIALRKYLEDAPGSHELQACPIVPTWEDWNSVTADRENFRHLRCTKKSAVVPVSSMVDHLILGLAISLRAGGFSVGFASGDKELLGASERFGVPFVYTHDLDREDGFAWKDCASDESCIRACPTVVPDCEGMFR